ncbi:MAG: hypothetical protein R3F60_23950 [bacterium]
MVPSTLPTYRRYAEQVGEGFRFWAKVHQDVTLARFPDLAAFGDRRGAPAPAGWIRATRRRWSGR